LIVEMDMSDDDRPGGRRVALITGAATGIGAACARSLASLGITVVGLDVDDDQGRRTFAELGAPHEYRSLDVRDPQKWRAAVASIVKDFGRLDIAHLNAGVMTRPKGVPLLDDALQWFTPEGYEKVMSVNLDGVVFGIAAILPVATLSQIIITASGAALLPLEVDPFYTASKYAVLGLGLALEPALKKRSVRLDILCPGAIDTPLTAPDIRAALKQEPASFIADCVARLVSSAEPGPVWMAFTQQQGLQRYVVPGLPGLSGALDVVDTVG
jgi:NAD(P)-dependent dehydrogenase (short-subunit alcohol dehydrogenase family)